MAPVRSNGDDQVDGGDTTDDDAGDGQNSPSQAAIDAALATSGAPAEITESPTQSGASPGSPSDAKNAESVKLQVPKLMVAWALFVFPGEPSEFSAMAPKATQPTSSSASSAEILSPGAIQAARKAANASTATGGASNETTSGGSKKGKSATQEALLAQGAGALQSSVNFTAKVSEIADIMRNESRVKHITSVINDLMEERDEAAKSGEDAEVTRLNKEINAQRANKRKLVDVFNGQAPPDAR